jgi:hypothetical protein
VFRIPENDDMIDMNQIAMVCAFIAGYYCGWNVAISEGEVALTDEEREAVEEMVHLIETQHEDHGMEAHYLRTLLERLG